MVCLSERLLCLNCIHETLINELLALYGNISSIKEITLDRIMKVMIVYTDIIIYFSLYPAAHQTGNDTKFLMECYILLEIYGNKSQHFSNIVCTHVFNTAYYINNHECWSVILLH